jgi:hypothetical protein
MEFNELNELQTIGDLIDYLSTFRREQRILKSDMCSDGYSSFKVPGQQVYHVCVNPDRSSDIEFIDKDRAPGRPYFPAVIL